MADKKSPASGWPIVTGEYSVGDPESPVAVVTLASEMFEECVDAGAALAGPCHTENLGVEKVVGNIISNPNIRFLVICGSEVQGHITGQCFEALHANGCDPEKKKVIGATGAIPFVENVPMEGVERFQQQLELVSMIDNEDVVVLENGSKIALKRFYDLEKNIMGELLRLQIGRIKVIESDFDEFESDYS